MDFYMTDLLKIYIHFNVIISDYTIIAEIGKQKTKKKRRYNDKVANNRMLDRDSNC